MDRIPPIIPQSAWFELSVAGALKPSPGCTPNQAFHNRRLNPDGSAYAFWTTSWKSLASFRNPSMVSTLSLQLPPPSCSRKRSVIVLGVVSESPPGSRTLGKRVLVRLCSSTLKGKSVASGKPLARTIMLSNGSNPARDHRMMIFEEKIAECFHQGRRQNVEEGDENVRISKSLWKYWTSLTRVS
jgi:hypothetical protein